MKRKMSETRRARRIGVRAGASFREVLSQYLADAKKRNLSFDLTHEQFRDLCQKPCAYGGCLPSRVNTSNSGEQFIYNGVDRVDSTKGYSVENCVPCCNIHNKMKSSLTLSQFLEYCQKVVTALSVKADD
jgi:hypothetical protein